MSTKNITIVDTRVFKNLHMRMIDFLSKKIIMNNSNNTEYNIRKQKEKTLNTVYTVHPCAAMGGKYCKSPSKTGGYVAWPKTEASKSADENKNFT